MRIKLLGVEVVFHWSLIALIALIAWNVTTKMPSVIPMSTEAAFACGLGSAILLLGSVLLHEFAHILVGRRFGIQFGSVTLFVLGGAARMDTVIPSAKSEFWMALAGPASSLAVFGLFYPLCNWLERDYGIWSGIALYVCSVNFALAVFNVFPFLPMDGGRVLRAGLWWITGKYDKATRIAGKIGVLGAAAFFVIGNLMFWGVRVPMFGKGDLGGLMLIMMSWFLFNAAKNEIAQASLSVAARQYAKLVSQIKTPEDRQNVLKLWDTLSSADQETLLNHPK
jgi:Zn-dependent protease